jgi:DNA-binding response OmpR family regulator
VSSDSQPVVVRVTVPIRLNDVTMPTESPRVAVVSEDAELSEACARVLRQEGYSVQTASHSGHALLACMEGPVDFLIAELAMDEGSGPALARRMRRYNPNLKAIFIARPGTVAEADGVLVRPFTRDDLLKRLVLVPDNSVHEATKPSAYF